MPDATNRPWGYPHRIARGLALHLALAVVLNGGLPLGPNQIIANDLPGPRSGGNGEEPGRR